MSGGLDTVILRSVAVPWTIVVYHCKSILVSENFSTALEFIAFSVNAMLVRLVIALDHRLDMGIVSGHGLIFFVNCFLSTVFWIRSWWTFAY